MQVLGAVFCRHVYMYQGKDVTGEVGAIIPPPHLPPQAQAIVVALLATAIALVVEQDFSPSHILLLVSSSVFSASVASALLASLMILIILTSQRLRINPDNVATPFAASLGDLVTLGLLSMVAQGLYRSEGGGGGEGEGSEGEGREGEGREGREGREGETEWNSIIYVQLVWEVRGVLREGMDHFGLAFQHSYSPLPRLYFLFTIR